MRFPSLDVMIQYGIYTVKELERFAKGPVSQKKITIIQRSGKDLILDDVLIGNCPSRASSVMLGFRN